MDDNTRKKIEEMNIDHINIETMKGAAPSIFTTSEMNDHLDLVAKLNKIIPGAWGMLYYHNKTEKLMMGNGFPEVSNKAGDETIRHYFDKICSMMRKEYKAAGHEGRIGELPKT